MKKFFNVLIAMCLLLSLGACTLSANTTINAPSTEISGDTNNNTQNSTPNNGTVDVDDLQSVIEETCLKLEDSVIGVTLKEVTYKNPTTPSLGTVEKNVSVGSGVIIKREEIKDNNDKFIAYKYYVVTNRHVVLEDATTSTVKFNIYAYLGNDDVEILADLVGYDAKVDVALITFNHSELIEPVKIGSSANLNKGSFAIAIGNPDGYDYYGSVTFGVISGPIRYIDVNTDDDEYNDFTASYIQHDVAINPGNSGGGLFDIHGNLIGINTLKLVASDIDNMGFAIPIDVVMTIVEDYLMKGIKIVRPRLGVLGIEIRALSTYDIEHSEDIMDLPDIYNGVKPYGIYVNQIYENTSLDGFGIEKHDIILSIGDITITRMNILTARLNSLVDYQVGDEVEVTFYDRSEGQIKTVKVVLKGE